MPRYSPRDFCAEPESFGYARTVRWILPTNEHAEALTRAAQMQHVYAVRIRQRAKLLDKQAKEANKSTTISGEVANGTAVAPEKALRRLALKTGASYPRLLRALRGEVVLRLDDIAWADVVLGQISEFAQPKPGEERLVQRPLPARS